MIKVKMKTSIAGDNFSYAHNQIVDLPEAQAKSWIASGICEAVAQEKPQEPVVQTRPVTKKTSKKKQ